MHARASGHSQKLLLNVNSSLDRPTRHGVVRKRGVVCIPNLRAFSKDDVYQFRSEQRCV